MELPKFVIAENTDYPDDMFVIHLDFPRFIINVANDEVEIMDEIDESEEQEIAVELEKLVIDAIAFFDREMERYEE